jgi:hypothetical protein
MNSRNHPGGGKETPAYATHSLTADILVSDNVGSSTSYNPSALHTQLQGWLHVLYVDDACTSQETHILDPTASYGESFTVLYVDDVRTSQETYLYAYTSC